VNHFGSRSKRGTEAAAILYSLVESAKRAGVEPAAYLDLAARAARPRRRRHPTAARSGRCLVDLAGGAEIMLPRVAGLGEVLRPIAN
jgi:hypothetical protein